MSIKDIKALAFFQRVNKKRRIKHGTRVIGTGPGASQLAAAKTLARRVCIRLGIYQTLVAHVRVGDFPRHLSPLNRDVHKLSTC